MKNIAINEVTVLANRQRQEFDPERIQALANSIESCGLLHPIVTRQVQQADGEWYTTLVAGECRIKAVQNIWATGGKFKHGMIEIEEGFIPHVDLGELDPIAAEEAELEENIRRMDLTWQERAVATSRLNSLRTAQAWERGNPLPTVEDIAEEVRGSRTSRPREDTRQEIIIAKHLDDSEVAEAPTLNDAFKIVKRKEIIKRNQAIGDSIGAEFLASQHKLIQGDCRDALAKMNSESFDVILSDPPYGMGADGFGDSGGVGGSTGSHAYKDDREHWFDLMKVVVPELYRVAKASSHAYIFCDIDLFADLRFSMTLAGWKVFRTPIIWHKPNGSRAPWPTQGPQRKYEIILYAVKGAKVVNQIAPDLITCQSDSQLGHHAQKPVALFADLLKRSTTPGERILDPFCGTGPVFPAAHQLKCFATGVEQDSGACGIAATRIKDLG